MVRTVIWDKPAYKSLLEAYEYIKRDSLQNAERVKAELLSAAQQLERNPERYPPDKLKQNNDGAYRAFEKYSYRVAYKVTQTQIVILRVRHVKQEPLTY